MTFILLDLAKSGKIKKIPYKHGRVCLFVTLKQAKKLITPDEPHAVYVLPNKKTSNSILQAALDILNSHPHEDMVIISPRTKLQTAITELQITHPQAKITSFSKVGKKFKTFIKTKNQKNEASATCSIADDKPISMTTNDGTTHQSEKNHHVFQLINDTELADQPKIRDTATTAALLLLKKNRPKKKNDLTRLLSDNLNETAEDIQKLITTLQNEGYIHIDIAENVRYQ